MSSNLFFDKRASSTRTSCSAGESATQETANKFETAAKTVAVNFMR
ncbi:MAG: hypothetical protein HGA76_03900 [Candidatus Firestonebacteria bacterium]|nr:hypothetical protein [Candidatus Firestonebacteria bacterium]